MSAPNRGAISKSNRTWPKRALALFGLIVILLYALILFTGERSLSPKLGIDLQGGTRVTLVPQGEEPTQDQVAQARTILEQRVNGMGVSGAEVVTNGNTLVITVPGEDTTQAQAVGATSQLLFRPVAEQPNPDPAALGETIEEMANRWVEFDLISVDGANQVLKQVHDAINPTTDDEGDAADDADSDAPTVTAEPRPEPENSLEAADRRDEMTEMLLKDRQSEDPTVQAAALSLMQCDAATDPLAGADDPALPFVTCDYDNQAPYLLEPAPLLAGIEDPEGTRLTGNEIDTNSPINGGLNSQSGQMEISFSFQTGDGPTGSDTWAKLTDEYLQKQIAITLDSAVISAPVIQGVTPYGSATSITGQFTQEQAQSLANNLRYGALPLSFTGEDGESGGTTEIVPPSLGKTALEAGLIAGVVGLLLVAAYSIYYFRALAGVSLITLVAAAILTYGSIVLLGRWIGYSLDLSGIAGLVIGIGATADSFVVYFERIKDELLEGRTFRSAATKAWERARATIITGNVVTLIGAVVVYMLAVGEVKGFAFTLGLTTVFDIVVSFLVMAPLMQIAARRPAFAKPSMNGLGGMFALVEERREQGFYAPGRNHRAAASTDSEAEGKEEPVNQLRSVVGPTSSASSTSEAPERSESGDDPSAKPSDQDSQEEK
ncbi:protein translocase subunit SecD [Corynebacterium stationis]|uniref:protein translocase subunit SecD n=1 Tax=Corynebacterium stationis TaxID=1705 RepID=UPI00076F7A18|nr:protein translocase subunit SecD [Corynebacterium stationis]AMJ44536.1 preprotein translocase subunit SecD [Corynebacterium stationis]AQX70991.1 protein translocase subunit SecD [Corynebacterium stationis]ASJ18678.1 protein-export membrane protein SecD [Corynebacterium stationis]